MFKQMISLTKFFATDKSRAMQRGYNDLKSMQQQKHQGAYKQGL
jgi:hypothetical protein